MTRADHRRRTLLALNAAAVEAIEIAGPDVSLETVAERAGVSRRTIYRWVATRDDLLFVHPRLWLETFDDAVATVADEPLATRVRVASMAVSDAIDADPEPVARSMRLALAHPQLMRGYAAVNQAWIDRLAVEVARDDAGGSRFRSRAIGAAVMGMIDAALAEWVIADAGTVRLRDLIGEGLDHLQPLLTEN